MKNILGTHGLAVDWFSLEPILKLCARQHIKHASVSSGNELPVRKLFELRTGEKCIVIGTLFKSMILKPSILKEISEEVRVET